MEHKYQKIFQQIMKIITAHNILKGFLVFACADIKFLRNRSPNLA